MGTLGENCRQSADGAVLAGPGGEVVMCSKKGTEKGGREMWMQPQQTQQHPTGVALGCGDGRHQDGIPVKAEPGMKPFS